MEWNQEVWIEVDPSIISNKDFQPAVRMAAYTVEGELDKEEEVWRINKSQFKKVLKDKMKWSYYRINKFIQVYIDTGIIYENNACYEFSKVDTSLAWTKLNLDTVSFCLDQLAELPIKIYCILLYRYNKFQYNHQGEKGIIFRFSRSQLCKAIGLTPQESNLYKITEALGVLSKIGLIEYSPGPFYEYDPTIKAPVPWMRLYKINEYSNVQKEVKEYTAKIDNDKKKFEKAKSAQSLPKPQVQEPKPYSAEIVVGEFNGEKTLDGKRWYDLDDDTRKFNHEEGFDELCLAIRGFCLGENYSIEKSDKLSQLSIKMWGKDYTSVLEEKPNYSDLF